MGRLKAAITSLRKPAIQHKRGRERAYAKLRGRGLVVNYGRAPVLRKATLELDRGEIVGLVGANGAGKTTLFRVLSGQLGPSRGEIALFDEREKAWVEMTGAGLAARARQGVGYLPQRPALLWGMTVRDNIEAANNSPASRAAERWAPRHEVGALLTRFGLEAHADILAAHLSGGQAKRLELARLHALRSRFVLCDEPFAGLDAESVKTIQQLLVTMAAAGTGVLITDHHDSYIRPLCHRLIQIKDGVCVRMEHKPRALD